MKRARFSPLARRDLDLIAAYVARDNPPAAGRVIAEFRIAAKRLALMPGLGHPRPDLTARPVLFWTVVSHLLVYRRTTRGIEIVRVIHGARDARRVLEEE